MANEQKFSFEKLSKQERLFVYIAAAFVIIAIFDRMIFETIYQRIQTIEYDIRQKSLLLKKNVKLLSQKGEIKKLGDEYSSYMVTDHSQEEEISAILKELETLARATSVNLMEIRPTDLKADKVIKKYYAAINCEGTMEQLAQFMYQIENSKILLSIDSYSLTVRDKEKGIMRCSMAVSKVVLP